MARKKGTEPNVVRLTPGSEGKVVITESHPGRYVLGSPVPSAVETSPMLYGPNAAKLGFGQEPSDAHGIANWGRSAALPPIEAHVEPRGQNPDTGDLKFVAHLQPVQLSSASNEHYTPSDIVERARRLMGAIDLDPASCTAANAIVQAKAYYSKDDVSNDGDYCGVGYKEDGLGDVRPWKGNVFLNPPGGVFKVLNKSFSNAALWWAALVQDWLSGDVKEAIFIGFTLEILRHSQNGCPLPAQAFHRCYPKKRIKFSDAQQPTHANVIVYLPPLPQNLREEGRRTDFREPEEPYVLVIEHFARFRAEFGSLGYCE